MRVAASYSLHDVFLEEMPIPDVGPGDLRVNVEACGLCGSDLSKLTETNQGIRKILGHEIAGVVVEKGKEVETFGVGDRIIAGHHTPCFTCHYCRHGSYSMCAAFKTSNLDPGGFSEFLRIPAANVRHVTHRIPEGLSFEEGTFVEPLACCLRALRRSPTQPGDAALVLGLGSIGLLLLQLFKALRLFAAGADLIAERRDMAQTLGADLVGSPSDERFLSELTDRTQGRGADLVLTASDSPRALAQALELVRDGGTVNLFGGTAKSHMELHLGGIYRREITLMASYSSSPLEFPEALRLLSTHEVRVSEMVTNRFRLDGLGQAIEGMLNNRGIKNIILPNTGAA